MTKIKVMKVIMYHYIRPEDESLPEFKYLHLDDFCKQLDFFEREYGFVDKADFFKGLSCGQPVPGVVLTFDDGLKDHYKYVLPELKRRGLWGFFYVCTGVYQSGSLLDVHRVHMLLGRYGGKEIYDALKTMITDDMLVGKKQEEFNQYAYKSQANDDYSTQVKKILNYFLDYSHKDAILGRLMESYFGNEADLAKKFYITAGEMAEMRQQGMIIGSHTVSHPVLSRLTPDEQEKEIKGSFAWLESALHGLDFKTFCYPYGGFHSFTRETEKILSDNNVSCSFNVEPRDIEAADLLNRPTALPRYDCNMFPYGKVR